MTPHHELQLMLSLGRLVSGEAIALADAASRVVERSDALIRNQLGGQLGESQLRHLAATVRQQHALMSALSASALSAVRLATRNLAPALERAQATPRPADRAHDGDEHAATRLLVALGELERSIHLAERRMHDAGSSIAHIAERAGRNDAAAVCASLIGRLVRGNPG